MTSTVSSEFFGMTFWFDEYNDLMYAPSYVDGGYDKDCVGYVSEWDDVSGEEILPRILDVIKELITHG